MSQARGLLNLTPVDADDPQRRADRRYERDLPIEFLWRGQVHVARTRNMSLGGVFIETDLALPYAARIPMRFRVPTLPDLIEVAGQVRWCESKGDVKGVGVRFDGLRAREVWALNKFFNRLFQV